MTINVRPATIADYPVAGEICVNAYRDDGQLDGGSHDYAAVLRDVARRANHAEIMVAEHGDTGDLVGCVTFALADTEYAELSRPGEGEFRMLAVDPAAQGRGVGKALAQACVQRATELGLRALVICSRDYNKRAISMYEKIGFHRVPELDWSPYPGVDLLALRLDLPTP